jgi:predicted ArsR family transcriptional regulator
VLSVEPPQDPADELFDKVRELLGKIELPKTEAEVAADLNISKVQAKKWLQRLVDEGFLEKHANPVRYGPHRACSWSNSRHGETRATQRRLL